MSIASSIDPLGLYAAAMDTSDYVEVVVPVVRTMAPAFRSLLDVGAGGGQLGNGLRDAGAPWTTIEPSALMQQRLALFPSPPAIIPSGWMDAEIAAGSHDLVLAATMPALFEQPEALLDRCLRWARHAVTWVVPAQNGPKGLILAGCLPSAWHGEDETPGIELTLSRLPRSRHPERMAFAEWTFSAIVPDIAAIASFLAGRLGWTEGDGRRPELLNHLRRQAKPDPAGHRLDIPRKSAILTWSI